MKTKKRRILVDGRAFSLQDKGGVSQMWAYLIGSEIWREQLELDLFVYPGYKKNIHLRDAIIGVDADYINLIECSLPPSDNGNFSGSEHKLQRKQEVERALCGGVDAVVNTYYGENVYTDCKRYIVTAYDFAHEEIPELALKPTTPDVLRRKKQAFSEATVISFISNASRLTCRKYYDLGPNVITRVIYLGHEDNEPHVEKVKGQIIHVGSRAGYKNFKVMESAIRRLMAEHDYLRFFVFGGEIDDGNLARLSDSFPGRIVMRQQSTDYEMDFAMKMSSMFISASLYEGFGIPLLNALRFGTIPIISDINVYRELAGDNAIYFDPVSEESLIAAIKAGFTAKSRPAGYWRTWNDVARDYLELLDGKGA